MDISKLRGEQEIFEELQVVCATPGFAHIIACFCARNNFIWYRHEMTAEDMQHLYSRSRLIRTEIFTLIGLMVQADPDYDVPPPPDATALSEQVEALLEELHQTMTVPWIAAFNNAAQIGGPFNPWTSGDALREPIFYGGEAAFAFQNCEFAALKYAGDNAWLIANRGASIEQMIAVTKAIAKIQNKKVLTAIKAEQPSPESGSLLPAFQFTVHEVAKIADLPEVTVAACIDAFAFNQSSGNGKFKALNDYSAVNGSPIIPLPQDRFLLFHFYALAEALYDSPFYWLGADKSYASTALSNRGNFTESLKMNRFLTARLVWRRRRGLDWAMGGLGWEGFGGEPAG